VSEVGVAALGTSVHVVGGYVGGHPRSTTHLVLYTVTGRWHRAAPLPVAADHVGVVALHGLLWAVGGYGDPTAVRSWDPATDRWTSHAALPSGRAAGVCVVLGGRIHYIGGKSNGADVSSHLVYDPATDHWSSLAPVPIARDHAAGAVVEGMIYVAVGRPGDLTDAEVYDPGLDRWHRLPPVPLGRSSVAGVELDGRFVVLGGEHPREQGVDTEVDAFDPATHRWSRLPALPSGRQGMGAAVVDGTLYVPGGGPVGGGRLQSAVLLELRR
jgi:hypothetical protein